MIKFSFSGFNPSSIFSNILNYFKGKATQKVIQKSQEKINEKLVKKKE